ncbi:MAG TPA: hypothetical protein VF322_15825 [Gammaproteobacteria bacterium]
MSSRPPSHDPRARLARVIELRYRQMRRRREERPQIGRRHPVLDAAAFEDMPYRILPAMPGTDAAGAARALLETMAEVAALLARRGSAPDAPPAPNA